MSVFAHDDEFLDSTSLYELSDSVCQVFFMNDFESFVQLFLYFFVYADYVLSAPISPVAVFVALMPAVFPVCVILSLFSRPHSNLLSVVKIRWWSDVHHHSTGGIR